MMKALRLERALFIKVSSLDRDINSYQIRAYASAIHIGIVFVGRRLNL